MAAAMAGTVAATGAPAQAAPSAPVASNPAVGAVTRGKLLVNTERVSALLDELGLDGVIAINPINVHYLTNMPVESRFRAGYPSFGILARDPAQPSFLVTSAAQADELRGDARDTPEIVTFVGAPNWRDHLDPLRTVQVSASQSPAMSAATPAKALAKALGEAGLAKARVAVDDMRIAHLLQQADMSDVTCVLGETMLRKARAVKTEPELALMRIAARNNALAASNTIKAIARGMTPADIARRFALECLACGNTQVEFLAGTMHAGRAGAAIVPGRPFVIDAVSHFGQYHGDFGRTVVLGEPDRGVLAMDAAHRAGRDAVLNVLKPGVRFSEIDRVARAALTKAGMPQHMIVVNPHTVGLEHGDNPARFDAPFNVPEDLKLEENMVLTVDLPYFESGWGAGHHEDLVRITATGFEPLATLGDPLVIV
jgi:Xaa-Pro aminopeptidase